MGHYALKSDCTIKSKKINHNYETITKIHKLPTKRQIYIFHKRKTPQNTIVEQPQSSQSQMPSKQQNDVKILML